MHEGLTDLQNMRREMLGTVLRGAVFMFGVLLAVNLRILGVAREVPFADVHRLLPWGMLGFGANLITGMFFFVGQPGQYTSSTPFYWKIVFLVIAGANFLYLTVFGKPWGRAADPEARFDASVVDKAMAIVSMAAWLAVPESILHKAPSGDLWVGQTDEGELGFTYAEVDRLLVLMVDCRWQRSELVAHGFDPQFVSRVAELIRRNHYKRRMPVIAQLLRPS